jgi:ferric-dicitrate binding protein FerR (iron transport regulator)
MKPDPKQREGGEPPERVAYLVSGYLRQVLSAEEHDELDAWITASDANLRLFEALTDPAELEGDLAVFASTDEEAGLARVKEGLRFGAKRRRLWLRYSVAACVLLLAGYFLHSFFMEHKETLPVVATGGSGALRPGGLQARLTLANGATIDLAKARTGLLDSSAGAEVLKTGEGQLTYAQPGEGVEAYHILETPVGGQYSVLLPDGSRVWLNAASRLRYPVAFTGVERVVELSGEAYFEVSKALKDGQRQPFIVRCRGLSVEVLGTRFNVQAYADEAGVMTTLLEGRVRLADAERAGNARELLPGQQASLGADGQWWLDSGVDTAAAVAWKNGQFRFINTTIGDAMRQVSRWYGAEVVYEGDTVAYHFNATIYRDEPVEKVLAVLSATKRVQFRVEGRRIYVRP